MKTLLRVSLLLVCLLGITAFAHGQVTVSGRVLNGTTGEPVPGLGVFLVDDVGQHFPYELGQESSPDEKNITTLEGLFSISDVLPDTWYSIDVFSGDILRYTDYIFLDSNTVSADNVVTLPDIVVKY
jgi:hypothetical protein